MNQKSITFYQKNLKELEGYRLFDMIIFKDIIKSLGYQIANNQHYMSMKMIPRERVVQAISLSNVFNVHIPWEHIL